MNMWWNWLSSGGSWLAVMSAMGSGLLTCGIIVSAGALLLNFTLMIWSHRYAGRELA